MVMSQQHGSAALKLQKNPTVDGTTC